MIHVKRFTPDRLPHKLSYHEREPSNQVNIDERLCAINIHNSSKISITKSSANDSRSHKDAKGLIKQSPRPEIYETMPYDSSIRLLRLHKGTAPDQVEVTLEFAQLDHTVPEYEAISYVWGRRDPVAYIKHRPSQNTITVTQSLQAALEHIRCRDRDRLVWVDALCINQGDGKEKGTQVRKMNAIYARASCVLVWLGFDTGCSNQAFGVLCALANETFRRQSHRDGTQLEIARHNARPLEGEPMQPVAIDQVPHISRRELWSKVMRFFSSPWFTRLWVLQEIVFAQEAILTWGDYSISWKYVGAAIEAIRQDQRTHGIHWLLNTRNLQNASFMWHLSNLYRHAECLQASQDSQQPAQDGVHPFLHLLDLARSLEVTDPRDKVYALLGFPTAEAGFNSSSLMPDYTLSTAEVYMQVTRSFIEKNQSLDVLGLVTYQPQQSISIQTDQIADLPSWAPNFNSNTIFPISNYNVGHQYSAGFSRPVCLLPSPTPATLRLKGVILDTIRVTGLGRISEQDYADDNLKLVLRWCLEAGISLPTIAATLTAGRSRDGQLFSSVQKDRNVVELVQLLKDEPLFRELAATFSAGTTNALTMETSEAKEALWRFITYRTPFITESGKLGLGPYYAKGVSGSMNSDEKEPDVVVVLWGGQCPVVVGRAEEDGRWVLKGECYVEDWMDGEAVEKLVSEEGKDEVVFEFV